MADEKDIKFKVTDRRKFNADGTPRDYSEPPAASAAASPEPQKAEEMPEMPGAATPTDNVVSFPGESPRQKAQPARTDEAEAAKSQAVNQAAQAYQEANVGRPPSAAQGSLLGLINMLASETAMLLGLIESPVEGGMKVDLDSARELIDLIGILEQKTKGNLTRDEEKVLQDILAYLRMQYVLASENR